jgi:hypothetical protein
MWNVDARAHPPTFLRFDCLGQDAMLVLLDIGFLAVVEAEIAVFTDHAGLLGVVRFEHTSSDDGVAFRIGAMHGIEIEWSFFRKIH